MEREIVLVAVGTVETQVLPYLCAALTEIYGCRCRVGDASPAPECAYNPCRAQYSAEMILHRLTLEEAERILGVADYDLCLPELNSVFGLAARDGPRALVALPRLRESF